MIRIITQKNATPRGHVGLAERFHMDASDIGLPPGTWPWTLETDLGNGQPFHWCDTQSGREGDSYLWVDYEQNGIGRVEIRIYND